jgi:hypothetical protein
VRKLLSKAAWSPTQSLSTATQPARTLFGERITYSRQNLPPPAGSRCGTRPSPGPKSCPQDTGDHAVAPSRLCGEVDGGRLTHGELIEAAGDCSLAVKAVATALRSVTLLIRVGVEGWCTAALRPLGRAYSRSL